MGLSNPHFLFRQESTARPAANFGEARKGLNKSIDFENVAKLALAHARWLVPRWLPDGRQRGAEWVARNPTRSDKNLGSFSVNIWSGRWADFATRDGGGDLISLKAYLSGVTQTEAARHILEELGHLDGRMTPISAGAMRSGAQDNSKSRFTQQLAQSYWGSASPAAGTIVERYLTQARALPPSFAEAFRFHPSVQHREARLELPAMIAPIFHVGQSGLQGIHVTYLTEDGYGKADVCPDKRMLGRVKGGGVWFGQQGSKIIVAEGIETVLSVRSAVGLPAVAGLSASLLPSLVLPSCVREVDIAADNDPAGKRAAWRAAAKWSRAGLHVRVAMPGEST